ncbi:MAG: hypothetical protein NC340_02530 [Ruminococcus flavefaciens]|nr:hypothetical protein [Ruminococcus flavefaciens]MCM1229350.1 hypothetical protein [Ruminococcus flavefaciens]
MKKYNKTLLGAFAAALTVATLVPVSASADETDLQYSSEWVTDEKGRIFYYNESGEFVTGEQEIDGEMYLFSKNGVQKTGWRTVDGKRKYYDDETGRPVYGWIDYCGKQYYIDKDKQTDCVVENSDGNLVVLSDKGDVITDEGFVKLDNIFYYVIADGILAKGETVIGDIPYYFDDTGRCGTGWVDVSGKKYYYNPETAEAVFGLFEQGGSYYYTDKENGMCTSVAEIDGVEYLFGEQTGKMQYGWLEINDNKRYFYRDSTYASGITEIDGTTYIFSDKGVLLTGLQTVDGRTYYADEQGRAVKGKTDVGEDCYYFGDDFSAQSLIFEDEDGSKYIFGTDGRMLRGVAEFEGNRYCLNSEDGRMMSGRLLIDGKKYYFNTTTGIMMTGRLIIDGNKYYFAEDGTMQFGMQEIDGDTYFFNKSTGIMMTGWQEIDGMRYYFNTSTGKLEPDKTQPGTSQLSEVQQRARTIVETIGNDMTTIYNYMNSNYRYNTSEEPKTLEQVEEKGWSYFAGYAMDNRLITSCYFAGLTDLLSKQAGYNARIVYGTDGTDRPHFWNQVYVNNKWLNYDACNGYCGVSDEALEALGYVRKQYVSAEYN